MIDGYRKVEDWQAYSFGAPNGTWQGRLDNKGWGKSTNLILYFADVASGEKWWFSVWHADNYQPRNGGINFKNDAEIGQLFELTTRLTKSGAGNLMNAARATA